VEISLERRNGKPSVLASLALNVINTAKINLDFSNCLNENFDRKKLGKTRNQILD